MMLTYILFLHFFADFILQSREMGQKKSTEINVLLHHLLIITGIMFVGMFPFIGLGVENIVGFVLLNTLIHGVIDWNIWRFYKLSVMKWMQNNPDHPAVKHYEATKEFKYWEDHLFFTTIGLDQFLHAATIVLLADWLLK